MLYGIAITIISEHIILPSNLSSIDAYLEALFSVPAVSEFDLSKSGKVVFISNKAGQFQLNLFNGIEDGTAQSEQLTVDEESKAGPKFSPDATKILYASDFQGDEKFNLFMYDMEKKTTTQITKYQDSSIYPNADFSRDGKKIAYISNQSKQFATYVLDLESAHTSRVSYHEFPDEYATIAPNSKFVAITGHIEAQEEGIFISSLQNPSSGLNEVEENHFRIDASQPVWSPDSKMIAFTSSSKGMYDIGLWSMDTQEVSWITKTDHEYGEPAFSNDGKKLAFTVNTGVDVKIVVHDIESKESKVLEFRRGIMSSPKFSFNDNSITFLFEGPRNPRDLWRYSFEDGKFSQLTNSLPEGMDVSNFVDGQQISYLSKDRLNIPALLYMPNKSASMIKRKKTKRTRGNYTRENLPAVIEIHGGPSSQACNEWNPFVQALLSRGFLVLRPNYRGSTGFGKGFREANRYAMGELDLADCACAKDFLVQQKLANPKKIAVMGGSYGGYLTMCCMTRFPDYWSCGVAIVPFLNWFTEIKNEREELRFWDLQNMGDPLKDEERLRNASPIFFVDRVIAPILLIAGANDPRCPLEESIQAREELRKLDRRVDLLTYQDEGHGFRKTSNKVDAYSKSMEFLRKNILHRSN